MSADPSLLRVFVSSTSEDLKAHRAVARQVIQGLGWHADMMEDFGALPTATVQACCDKLQACDLVLLIVAFRRGWVPSAEQGGNGRDSVTALELAHARAKNIPVLCVMAKDDWPGNLWDRDPAAYAWITDFRANLNLPSLFFGHEDSQGAEEKRLPAFRLIAKDVLLAHKQRLLALQQADVGPPAQGVDYFPTARDSVLNARGVPVIGHGVYGDGPLSARALARALGGDADARDSSLATVAEYRERLALTRENFLDELTKVVAAQSRDAALPASLQMLLKAGSLPPLIVATTHDQLLEDALAAEGTRRFVVITHILRSADGEHDGKILVLRPGQPEIITPADKVELATDECVIYRPLGSPLLHARLDPNKEIDTVVITETDHLTFLGRLDNQHMRVPTRFTRWLQKKPLLFLGYGLDLWHYRLVMHVFRAIGGRTADVPALAIRKPTSGVEAASWTRLGANLVLMDVNEFALQVT